MLFWFRPLVWTKNYILYSSFHFKTCSSIKVLFTHELCSISEKSFGICFPKCVQFLYKQAGMFSTKFFLIWITQKETVCFTHVRLTGNALCASAEGAAWSAAHVTFTHKHWMNIWCSVITSRSHVSRICVAIWLENLRVQELQCMSETNSACPDIWEA